MDEFHAIIVDKSLIDESTINKFDVIGKQVGGWTLYKIKVSEDNLDGAINTIQSNMQNGPWYFHFYNHDGSKMIVVFKEKSFKISKDISTWGDAIEYGLTLGTPREQLDFAPSCFADEAY